MMTHEEFMELSQKICESNWAVAFEWLEKFEAQQKNNEEKLSEDQSITQFSI